MYQVSPDDPVWGEGRFIPGPVTKDKDGNYWIEDYRTGLRYQLDKDNCDPDTLIARQEKEAAGAKKAKKNPPTFEEKDTAYWKWLRAKTIHDVREKKKQLFDNWRARRRNGMLIQTRKKGLAPRPPVAPDATEPPKPGEEQLYPGVKGTIAARQSRRVPEDNVQGRESWRTRTTSERRGRHRLWLAASFAGVSATILIVIEEL